MSIEIIYNGGSYDIRADGFWIDTAETYHDGYQIEAAYLEAKHSAMMGGDPLLVEISQAVHNAAELQTWLDNNQPIQADCAAIIRQCLGQTTGAQSIVDELRRVEQRLTSEGW